MNEKDNTLRVRLDKEHQRMFRELREYYERTDPDMLRWLIRKAHEQMYTTAIASYESLDLAPTI